MTVCAREIASTFPTFSMARNLEAVMSVTTSTTLKLTERLKAQVKRLARKEGKTPHAWMVLAIAAQAERSAKRAQFVAEALEAAAEVERTGRSFAGEEVHAYLRARATGKKHPRPSPVRH